MRTIARWTVAGAVLVHGLVHLLGAAEGLGWAEASQLTEPIGAAMGAVWLGAGILVVLAAVALAVASRGWWVVAAVAAVASQAVISTSWSDAWAGTAGNALLLLAAGYGYASQGPASYRAEYRRRAGAALAQPVPDGIVTEADLRHLPPPVAAYVRQAGGIGQPRIGNFRARFHGRIRQGADKPWMPYTAEQVNTYGSHPSRSFLMDATMFGLPVDVLHTFAGPQATMRAKVGSLVPVVDAAGDGMAQAETVTLFNDLCVFAPAALVDAPVAWKPVDGQRVVATYTNGDHSVTAELVFNDRAELVDFVSDDRLAASPDGKEFTPQRWSTPLRDYRDLGSRRVATSGEGRWHPAGAAFTYIEFHLDDIAYNLGASGASAQPVVHRPAPVSR